MSWWSVVVAWDWASMAKTAIGAGLGTLIVQALLPIMRDRWSRKRQAAYLAMRLAVALEAFAAACSNFNSANRNAYKSPEEERPDWTAALPELAAYPDDGEGWRSIDHKLAGRCLEFRNKLQSSQGVINSTIEFAEEDLGDVLDEQASECGLEAWSIATALRSTYALGKANDEWNCAANLRVSLEAASERKRQRNNEQAKIQAMVFDNPSNWIFY